MKTLDERVITKFTQHCYAKLGVGEVTIGNYVSTLRRVLPQLNMGMRPSADKIEKHVMAMRKAGKSHAHVINTCVALERYCAFQKISLNLGRPKKPKRIIRGCLSEAEIALLIAATRNLRQRTIVSLLAYSGVRNKELCSLRVEDVDIANQMIHVRGTKPVKERNVNITPACVSVLLDYLHERNNIISSESRLFLTERRQQPLEQQDLRKMMHSLAKRAKLSKRVYPHLLRHSLATNMLHRGANLLAIKEQLGHAFVETTMIYLHAAPARMKAEYQLFAPSYL